MDKVAARWRELFLDTLRGHEETPIYLSGGTDSGTVLAGLLELDVEPVCYTFVVGNRMHEDARVASKMCADHNLDHRIVSIPRNEEQLVADIKRAIRELFTVGYEISKAKIQCVQPMIYLAERLVEDDFDEAYLSTGAVCLDDRTVDVLLNTQGEEAAREYRTKKLLYDYGSATEAMKDVSKRLGVTLYEPYSVQPFADHALSLDMAELNYPVQKGIALRAFPEFWSKGYYRTNSPLQVNSGIREWHDTLLKSEYNTRDAQAIIALYNDFERSERVHFHP